MEKAYLASGCFWCTETIFDNINGVTKVIPGYMGGTKINPTYEEVCTGLTGHAELVEITYDSNLVSFEKLLEIFFKDLLKFISSIKFIVFLHKLLSQ